MYLSHDDILKADDLPTRDIEVPEWSGTVRVRGLTGEERDAFEASLVTRRRVMEGPNKGSYETIPNTANGNAKLVAKSIIDADGNRVFTDGEIADLGKKSAAALTRVFEAAAELSGMKDTDVADAEGNSEPAPSGDGFSKPPSATE